jgi:hypothetical protein
MHNSSYLHFFDVKCIEKHFRPGIHGRTKGQRLHELVDPALGNGCGIAEIKRCAQAALLCAQEDPADRPTITDVAGVLNPESMSLPMEPKQTAALGVLLKTGY